MESYYQLTTSSYPYFVNQNATRSTTNTTASSNTDSQSVVSEPIHNQRETTLSWENFPQHLQLEISHKQECVECSDKSIILDNGLSMSIFHDRELVSGIRKAKQPIKITTNAGSRAVCNQADIKGFGTV